MHTTEHLVNESEHQRKNAMHTDTIERAHSLGSDHNSINATHMHGPENTSAGRNVEHAFTVVHEHPPNHVNVHKYTREYTIHQAADVYDGPVPRQGPLGGAQHLDVSFAARRPLHADVELREAVDVLRDHSDESLQAKAVIVFGDQLTSSFDDVIGRSGYPVPWTLTGGEAAVAHEDAEAAVARNGGVQHLESPVAARRSFHADVELCEMLGTAREDSDESLQARAVVVFGDDLKSSCDDPFGRPGCLEPWTQTGRMTKTMWRE